MGKHSDWSGVTEILGRAASELRSEVKGIALDKSGNARASLANAVDNIADKIRAAPAYSRSRPVERQGVTALPILLGIGTLLGVAVLASGRRPEVEK
ncbi:MAG: hypothetical protein ABWZ40_06625 [Caulobacterales bacterium]